MAIGEKFRSYASHNPISRWSEKTKDGASSQDNVESDGKESGRLQR
jgi:hypothetical protein